MKKSIKISIPEPCHEDWAKMTPTEKGKFCSVCTKEVFDFTNASDEELVKKISAGKNLCGRFKTTQLNRGVTLERKSGNSLLPYAASLLVPLSILSTSEVESRPAIEKPFISLGIGSNPAKSIVTVTGLISDQYGNPISNAEIIVLDTGNSYLSNTDGTYSIKCASGSTLFFQKGNLAPFEVTVGTKNSIVNILLENKKITKPILMGKIAPTIIQEKLETKTIECKNIQEEVSINEEGEEKFSVVITGNVVDDRSLPLTGVTILIKGTSTGTQTDFDGNYKIEVNPNQTLVFSYLGYETKEILVGNISNIIDLKMQLSSEILLGVVIVSEEDAWEEKKRNSISTKKQTKEERREHAKKEEAYLKHKKEQKKKARKQKRDQKKNNK